MSKAKFDFEGFLRKTFQAPLDAIAGSLLKLGVTANFITLLGLVGNIVAAYLIARGQLLAGGLVAALMAPLDALDGALARKTGITNKFGAFLDSVVDRYDEMILLAGVLYYFQTQAYTLGVMLTYAALCGSVLVSYTRARAEGLGFSGKAGLFSRIERSIVLILGLVFNQLLISVGIIAILANVTALQRIFFVWKQSKQN
ncbi:MAG TPA: CDP-alcohol phosphatidyltransferase family protein [Anaerolineaceae bacterium]|nr:CDP-alcohol phosphatidyltransferase family protein [Anaerolineaceae bacterium]